MRGKNFFAGNRRSRSLKSPSFANIVFTFSPDLDLFRNSLQKKIICCIFSEIHCTKKHLQKVWGGPWPPWPPPGYATDSELMANCIRKPIRHTFATGETSITFETPQNDRECLRTATNVWRSFAIITNSWRTAFVSPFAIYSPQCETSITRQLA